MTADSPKRLPPVAILIVEDHGYVAKQFGQLVVMWGAAAADTCFSLDGVIAHTEQHTEPTLVLLDHVLGHKTSVDIALWLAARPAIRSRLRVAAYTNADQYEILKDLRVLIGELARDTALAELLLGQVGTAERRDIESQIQAAWASDPDLEHLYKRLYDAHLSKRLAMHEVRQALRELALSIAPGD